MKEFADTRAKFVEAWKKALEVSRQETVDGVEERNGSRTLYTEQVEPLSDEVANAATALKKSIHDHAAKSTHDAHASATSGKRLIWIVALLALAAAAALATWVTRSVTRPVGALGSRLNSLNDHCLAGLTGGLEAVAQGDLTVQVTPQTTPVEVTSSDELGKLCETFNGMLAKTQRSVAAYNEMQQNLSTLIGEVAGNATTVASASQQMASTSDEAGRAVGEIANAVGDVAQGAERQVRMVETAREAAQEAAGAASTSAERAQQTAVAAEEARDVAREGVTAAEQASGAIRQLADSSAEVGSAIQELAARSERIGDIAGAAEQISAETTQMETSIGEVAAVAEQSSASAEQVSASTQQTSASTQEIAASAQELARTAEQLQQLVARFRVAT